MKHVENFLSRDVCSWSDGILKRRLGQRLKEMKAGKLDRSDKDFLDGSGKWKR